MPARAPAGPGLIAEWVVQNKINASLESVSRARGQVGDLLYQLKSHISDTQAILQAVNRQREMFVQQYQG